MFTILKRSLLSFCFAMAIAFSVQAEESTIKNPHPAQIVISSQLDAFKQRDHARAYSFAAPGVKAMFRTVERFIEVVKNGGYLPIYNNSTYSFGKKELLKDELYQEVTIVDQKGKQWRALYTLRKQPDGSWKITAAFLREAKGTAT